MYTLARSAFITYEQGSAQDSLSGDYILSKVSL